MTVTEKSLAELCFIRTQLSTKLARGGKVIEIDFEPKEAPGTEADADPRGWPLPFLSLLYICCLTSPSCDLIGSIDMGSTSKDLIQ